MVRVVARARIARVVAVAQLADLTVSQISRRYGNEHLDHLGVPAMVRPALPVIKATAVVALGATAAHPRLRSIVAASLVSYYAAATTFHVLAKDPPSQAMPAVGMAICVAVLV